MFSFSFFQGPKYIATLGLYAKLKAGQGSPIKISIYDTCSFMALFDAH